MKTKLFNNKCWGIILIAVIYILVLGVSYLLSFWINEQLLKLLFIDIVATILIWIISLLIHNSSLYDPYWSITPTLFVIYMMIINFEKLNAYNFIFIFIFLIWGIRLTINWAITFTNLKTEDWRYVHFRELGGIKWHLANFFGIMMMPTLFVFIGYMPIHYFLSIPGSTLSLIGSLVVLFGILLELISDHQVHKFLNKTKEKVTCSIGLWNYSRHPNYLGEILIWGGGYLALLLTNYEQWYLFFGVLVMILLFNFISVPLMEKRQVKRRSDYVNYQKSTSKLLLLPKRKK